MRGLSFQNYVPPSAHRRLYTPCIIKAVDRSPPKRLACRPRTKPLTLPPTAVPAIFYPSGSPWFRVKKMPREQYRELLERQDAERAEAADQALSDSGSEAKKSVKDRIDEAW